MSGTALGNKFGRSDLERIGLFSEMPYASHKYQIVKESKRGTAFLGSGSKTKSGTNAGYFEKEFKRLFEGEAIRKHRKINPNKGLTPFIINTVGKQHSTPGDFYGTFTKELESFSPKMKPPQPFVHEPHNFLTGSGKKGGPGYVNITLSPYYEHLPDPWRLKMKYKEYGVVLDGPMYNAVQREAFFDKKPFSEVPPATKGLYLKKEKPPKPMLAGPLIPTGPAKWQGGSHAGCFNKFPEFIACKYVSSFDANKDHPDKKIEIPHRPPAFSNKTFYTKSIIQHYIDVKLNSTNYKTYIPVYCKHLLCADVFK